MKGTKRKSSMVNGKSTQMFDESQGRQKYPQTELWLEDPQSQCRFVLEALRVANLAFDRAVSMVEIMKAFAPWEEAALTRNHKFKLLAVTYKMLALLLKTKDAFIAGQVNGRRYYGAHSVCSPETAVLPEDSPSRRSRVLILVRRAVQEKGAALRLRDILDFTSDSGKYPDLTLEMIRRAVYSLKETGELKIAGAVRSDGKGFNFYLPSELSTEDYPLNESGTWLEFVVKIFREIWREHLIQAESNGTKPFPVTTGKVRAKILESGEFAEKVGSSLLVANAMQQLAVSERAAVKKIKRPKQKGNFWIPVETDFSDVAIGDTYAHDTERVNEAVRRAVLKLGRPVNFAEIKGEVKADSLLSPVSSSNLGEHLGYAAKEGRWHSGFPVNKGFQHVYRIGKVNGKAYYHHLKTPAAMAYVKYRQLEVIWHDICPKEQLIAIEECGLKTVAAGRIKLLALETGAILSELKDIQKIGDALGTYKSDIECFRNQVISVVSETDEWLQESKHGLSCLPQKTTAEIVGWTAAELIEQLQMFYPRARALSDNKSSIQGLIGNVIRRIPNPDFERTSNSNPRLAAENLYDETDAKIYIAKEWGGAECRLQAVLAANELGLLRDSRFVIPALDNKDYSLRLSAVACLAFLPSVLGNSRLRDVAVSDGDAGVRQSALWAYGFAGGENAIRFIEERSLQDRDPRVRNFAREMLEAFSESWFSF